MAKNLESLKHDRFSGSFELSQKSLHVLSDYITGMQESNVEKMVTAISKFAKSIIKTQPNMVNIRKKITLIVYHAKRLAKSGKSADEIKQATAQKVKEVLSDAEKKRMKIGSIGSKLILNNTKVMTISSSSMIKEMFLSAHKLGRKFSVCCLESRPQNEGHILAEALSKKGILTTLVTDAMMGQMMSEVNMIICGADRIYESGFVNKSGTLPLAITARTFQVPFYLAAETDKILKEIDRTVRFYPQDPKEIYTGRDKSLTVLNYYFEAVSFDYVNKVICEDGVFDIEEFKSWYLED
jgi:translation initiation factor 2B subunit (eIF-2B alpha/beta/delta family)